MRWPWVSRKEHEEVIRQRDKAEAERVRLLDQLLGGSAGPDARVPVEDEELIEARKANARVKAEETKSGGNFVTPFDSIGARFDRTFKGKVIPDQFRARAR